MRAGFWRVLAARLSPLDVSPGRWFPRAERRNHSTQRCPAATLMRDLFCSVAKNAPLQKMQIRRIQVESKPPLGRTRTRMTSAKTWCLTVGSPARAGPFSEPCATARARWTPPKATRPATRSRPHRAVPTSQRHGYQAEDVRHPLPRRNYPPPNSTAFLATPRRACSSRDRRAPLERPHRPSESIPFVFPLVFPVERSVPIHRRFARTPLRRS